MKFTLPKIYPITDTRISGLSHVEQVRRLIAGGARFIQLREKHAGADEFYNAAVESIAVARKHGATIIINDRVDLALATDADGVHVGQDDLPPKEARGLIGANKLVGFSTHSVAQAIAAIKLPIDYIAIGPIFGTTTKEDPDPVVGLDGLKSVREAIGEFPLVAIGGITRPTARSVLRAGADSVAIISDLLSAPAGIEAAMRELNDL
ncbi:MAG TPA: thiamine phosphate synthase [Pyrinomonadaceae bacterium]|nr:thiamine phosphate synthase [Pyrinomonadaceae bacterium]